MTVEKEKIEAHIREYSEEAQKLVDEMQAMEYRKGEVQERLVQITGGIAALQRLIPKAPVKGT